MRVAFVTRRTSPQVKAQDDAVVMTYPEGLFRAAVAIEILAVVLVVISLIWNAPLEELADPMHTPNPAKAPWYFLGLQELLHYFPPFVAGVLIPTMVVVALIVIPYFNINVESSGVWLRNRDRRLRAFIAVLAVFTAVMLLFHVYAVLVPTLADRRLHAHCRQPRAGHLALPALAGVEAAFLLDHDVVSGAGRRPDRSSAHSSVVRAGRGSGPGGVERMRRSIQKWWQFFFGDSARAFGTLSVVLLVCLAIAPAKDRFREWTRYQAQVPAADSRARRRCHVAAAFSGRVATDLDAGTRRDGSLRHLPSGLEGSQPGGRGHAAVPAAPARFHIH